MPAGEASDQNSAQAMPVLFSDLDGTCIHYQESMGGTTVASACDDAGLWDCVCGETGQRTRLLRLPPSTSGAAGVISLRTLERYAALRALGVKLVLISGARSSTLLQRLPWLPAADAYVCESGGRVFYPGGPAPTAAPLTEDLAWRRQLASATGPLGQEALPPLRRSGLLWQHYARLASAPGLTLDAAAYSTAFRVKASPERLAALPGDLPPGLASAVNLGAADVFPAGSGKEAAAQYLLARWGHAPGDCAFMCDDDNDLKLAALVGRAYLPGITAQSVAAAVAADPGHFMVAPRQGVFGCEDCLAELLEGQLRADETLRVARS